MDSGPTWAKAKTSKFFQILSQNPKNPIWELTKFVVASVMREPYPDFWPQPDAQHPEYLQSRITEEQKQQLYNREITTRALAKELGVTEKYLSFLFHSKRPIPDKKQLVKVRKEFQMSVAAQVVAQNLSIKKASQMAHTSYSTMLRRVRVAKNVR